MRWQQVADLTAGIVQAEPEGFGVTVILLDVRQDFPIESCLVQEQKLTLTIPSFIDRYLPKRLCRLGRLLLLSFLFQNRLVQWQTIHSTVIEGKAACSGLAGQIVVDNTILSGGNGREIGSKNKAVFLYIKKSHRNKIFLGKTNISMAYLFNKELHFAKNIYVAFYKYKNNDEW